MTAEDHIITIGQVLMRAANASTEAWDYAGWMFETRDGDSSSGTNFAYGGRKQLNIEFDFEGLCCTNRVMDGVPLSPDRLIRRLP